MPMNTMRLAATVLPVGTRGTQALEDDDRPRLWFAVQVTAGFAPEGGVDSLDQLWPWKFLVRNQDGEVELRAWRIKRNQGSPILFPVPLEVAASDADEPFSGKLQSELESGYQTPPEDLDTHLYFPSELPADDESRAELLENNFPARVSYLAGLPGEVARRTLGTVYASIAATDLFEKEGEEWKPRDDAHELWIVPVVVARDGSEFDLQGEPAEAEALPPLWTQDYDGADTRIYGPGYTLARFLEPADKFFDLSTHWLDVRSGDARFADLEAFLVNVLDPLSETSRIPLAALRGKLKSLNEPLDEGALQAARRLWRIQAFEGLLRWSAGLVPRTLRLLVAHLDPEASAEDFLVAVPEAWREFPEENASLMQTARVVASQLGVLEPQASQAVRAVAERAELGSVARWIQLAFEETIRVVGFPGLERAWEFADLPSASPEERARVVADKRSALVQLTLEEGLQETLVGGLLRSVLKNVPDQTDVRDKLIEAVQAEIGKRWPRRLEKRVAEALAALDFSVGETLELDPDDVGTRLAKDHVSTMWPAREPERENAGRPMFLLFGNPKQRWVHEQNEDLTSGPANTAGGVFNEVTGQILFVRRHEREADVVKEPWRLVSGGVAVVGRLKNLFIPEDQAPNWLNEPLPIPEENAFVGGLLRSDRGYDGQLRHIQSPLDWAYAASAGDASDGQEPDGIDVAYTYQGVGLYAGTNPYTKKFVPLLKAPPLRFGDWYQFAAAIVDGGSGLPNAVARPEQPWRLDLSAFAADSAIPPSAAIPYRRRQPVGEVSILPKDQESEWAPTPSGVVPRAREWHAARRPPEGREAQGADSVPEILLWDFGANAKPSYIARFEPPTVDEFTLRRWETPPKSVSATKKKAVKEKLKRSLVKIYSNRKRSGPNDFEPKGWVHDPAVSALGVRVQVFDTAGQRILSEDRVKILKDGPDDYRREPIRLRVEIDPTATDQTIRDQLDEPTQTKVEFDLRPGWFAGVDVWPLVDADAFEERFDAKELFTGVLEQDDHPGGTQYVAFRPSPLICEVATDRMPTASELYDRLKVSEEEGAAVVSWRGPKEDEGENDIALQLVDRFELYRDRWKWRNRPVVLDLDSGVVADDSERRRLAASGLPLAAFDEAQRDEHVDVWSWEARATPDRGFIDRGAFSARWPRRAPTGESDAGAVASDVRLLLDDREGSDTADYLRFGLQVWSRYAPLLGEAGTVVAARVGPAAVTSEKSGDEVRRIVIPYPIQKKIKPPKILGIVPLTKAVAEDPLGQPTATPFLVIVDECWFREYGIGERLEVELARENPDLGETTEPAERPYRTGPLPDHWLPEKPPRYYRQKDGKPSAERVFLDAFGPFGYTLDTTPDEALANASAFIVHPPRDVGPHWASFVRFRRVLHSIPFDPDQVSAPSDSYALYTLPDTERLVETDGGHVKLALDDKGYAAHLVDMSWTLSPLRGGEDVPHHGDSEKEAKKNYRYFLLVTDSIVASGQNSEIEVPYRLMRLVESAGLDYHAQLLEGAEPLAPGDYHGRILEVVVNGQYPKGKSRLDPSDSGDLTEREYWRRILPPHGNVRHDAAGMIRGFSESFWVRVE